MFRYITTDAQVLGIATWVGLLVTVAGFWIAIAQIRKARTAAMAATEAVSSLVGIVRSQEQSARIDDALGHLRSAQAMIKQDNTNAAEAYLSIGWASLIAARELTIEERDRQLISEFVLATRQILDEVSSPATAKASSSRAVAMRHASINRTLDGLGVLSARLKANLSGIGVAS